MKEFTPAKRHIEVSVGESVRILRELQDMTRRTVANRGDTSLCLSATTDKTPRSLDFATVGFQDPGVITKIL